MSKTKSALPETLKLEFTTPNGVPTITIGGTMTTRAQVAAVVEQLGKLAAVLPEAKARKAKAKAKPPAPSTEKRTRAAETPALS